MKTRMLVAMTMLAAAVAMNASVPTPNPKPLAEQVRHELVMLPWLSIFDDLQFRMDGTRVVLLGQTVRPVLKSDAENVVKRIPGITAVRNEIRVLPLSRFDDDLRLRVARAVYGYGPLNRYALGALPSIHIIVEHGVVRLTGVVANSGDRTLAFMRASGVGGSFQVINDLIIERKS